LSTRLLAPSRPRGAGQSTSQGHLRTVFKRALQHENLIVVEATVKGIGKGQSRRGTRADIVHRQEGTAPASARRGPLAACVTSKNTRRRRSRRREWLRRACGHSAAQATMRLAGHFVL